MSTDTSIPDLQPGLGVAVGLKEALFTDLYELTMLQTYFVQAMEDQAVFSLFVRRLPERRNFLLACGLDTVLEYLEALRFTSDDIAYLRSLGHLSDESPDSLLPEVCLSREPDRQQSDRSRRSPPGGSPQDQDALPQQSPQESRALATTQDLTSVRSCNSSHVRADAAGLVAMGCSWLPSPGCPQPNF
jgi:hypothetical protein